MDTNQVKTALLDIQAKVNALVSSFDVAPVEPQKGPEVPHIFDAMKTFVDAADRAGKIDLTKYGIGVFQPGYIPGVTQPSIRMSADDQAALEAEIRALAKSDWGQEWLSHNENAVTIDRGYSFEFAGYWVSRLPDSSLAIHTTAP